MIQSHGMRYRPKIIVGVFLIFLFASFLIPAASGALTVEVKGDRLTLDADKDPLQEILEALRKKP
ncbi:MAG: hypothetical protein ACM335_10680 [Deltaproteobacteria bacterium]